MKTMDELILVSTDDHTVEPPDVFEGRVPAKYADRAPRVVEVGQRSFNWVFDGSPAPSLTTAATAGRGLDDHDEPTSYEQIRPGTYNIHERVKDMNANGVLGSMCFPSFPRFAGSLFLEVAHRDADLSLAVTKAYNDWNIEDWCGAYPGRFIPICLVPLWDPEEAAKEIRRMAELGCHAVAFSKNPYTLGLPSLHSDHWDPFWAACEDCETVVCVHIGSDGFMIQTAPDAPMLVKVTCSGINIYPTAADLLWSPMMYKFPKLMFALSEGGIGWVPYFLERADFTYEHHIGHRTDSPFYGQLPSERFKERIITCFIDDIHGVESLGSMNVDTVTWECDDPHPDSQWPNSPEGVARYLPIIHNDEIVDKITHLNTMRLFKYDPFSVLPKEQCTVGALRATVPDHDTSFVPGKQFQLGTETQGQVSSRIAEEARKQTAGSSSR